MDKRLILTEKQKSLVAQFIDVLHKLSENNVQIIDNGDGNLSFINAEDVVSIHYPEDYLGENNDSIEVQLSELDSNGYVYIPTFNLCCDGCSVQVLF